MLAITEEMRESARKLLIAAKLNSAEQKELAERRNLAVHAVFPYKLTRAEHKVLDAIANGTRKQVDGRWWNDIHRVVAQAKLDKLSRLADPARNDNIHERDLANAKLTEFKARRPPGAHSAPPPLPETTADWMAKRKPTAKSAKPKAGPINTARPGIRTRIASVNTTQTEPSKAKPVNTTKPRSADRHLEPNRDRHSPGYMAEYMRKWRDRHRGKP